jgi:hypothetical protein
MPQNFGYKNAWIAVRSEDSRVVAEALGLTGVKAATWQQGVEEEAYAVEGIVFVTPPLQGWVLAAGVSLFSPDDVSPYVRPLIERLSSQFGEAQYFATHRVVEFHVWASASSGRLSRGFAYLGESSPKARRT